MDRSADTYLVDEALKRAPVVWVARTNGSDARAAWCAYLSPALYMLSGGSEQRAPEALGDDLARLIVRSKDDHHRLVEVDARVSVVRPGDDDHDVAWRAVDAARLHRHIAPDTDDCTLHRLLPLSAT